MGEEGIPWKKSNMQKTNSEGETIRAGWDGDDNHADPHRHVQQCQVNISFIFRENIFSWILILING